MRTTRSRARRRRTTTSLRRQRAKTGRWTGDARSTPRTCPTRTTRYKYNFKPGEPGKLVLEFWITPFDYAGCEGPERAVESVLTENKLIGLSWAVIDYNDPTSNKRKFWNLSHKQTFFGNASDLVGFRLMPLEPQFRKPIDAQWSFKVVDAEQRLVAFKDASDGQITAWKWDFGDGTSSTEQNPIHQYKNTAGERGQLYGRPDGDGACGRVASGQGVGGARTGLSARLPRSLRARWSATNEERGMFQSCKR